MPGAVPLHRHGPMVLGPRQYEGPLNPAVPNLWSCLTEAIIFLAP
jgi:hypothetical protein